MIDASRTESREIAALSTESNERRLPRLRRGWAKWLLALVVVVMFGWVSSSSNDVTAAFDPESTEPNGTRALALLLERFGSSIEQSDEPKGTTAVVFVDNLTRKESDALRTWVRDGGTLVVADPGSQLLDVEQSGEDVLRQPRTLRARCDSELVAGIQEIEPERRGQYAVFESKPLTTSCFAATDGSFMQVDRLGDGRIVAIGGGNIFTNAALGDADNSVLAMNLLHSPGGGPVTFVETSDVTTSGEETLGDLIAPQVHEMVWQLVIAGLLLIFWRSRRVGKPVTENAPVELPGSQLTVAVGNLLHNADRTDGAARALRADLRKTIAELLGVTPDTDPSLLCAIVSERTGVDRARLLEVIVDSPVNSSRELVDLAQRIEAVHREVANAR